SRAARCDRHGGRGRLRSAPRRRATRIEGPSRRRASVPRARRRLLSLRRRNRLSRTCSCRAPGKGRDLEAEVGMARSALAALVIGVVSLTLVAAATSASPPSALKNGGTLTIGLAEEPDALDPSLSSTTIGLVVFINMCEKLYDLNAQRQIVPQLAA